MEAILALLPILVVLILMVVFRWSSALAGLAGWAAGLIVALLAFGLNLQVLWVSQVKGLLLTLNVILLLWPGILLYNLVDQVGGIQAIARAFQGLVRDHGWLLVMQAWMLSGLIESVAGFGLPIAMVAPLLISLGVAPIPAVATAAVGHTWASSTGGMALSLRLLADITRHAPEELFPLSALLLGISIVLSGLAVTWMLKQKSQWWRVLITGSVAATAHYLSGVLGLMQVSALIGGVVGLLVGTALNRAQPPLEKETQPNAALEAGGIAYGLLAAVILLVTLVPPVNRVLSSITWTLQFPAVSTTAGFSTPAEKGYLFHIFSHPGTLILFTIAVTLYIFRHKKGLERVDLGKALKATWRSGLPASVGTLFMIGLSTTMEHAGMTQTLATALGSLVNGSYALFAPLIGVVGSFATGSNVSSNVLFGVLQEKVALLVGASPVVVLAAQTTGGSLGSSIAPAKLALGTSTSSARGHEGDVLRITLPICVAIAVVIGLVALLIG
jgi:lactate permease